MIIKYSPAFLSKLKRVDVRVRKSVKERILLFSKNPYDLQLNNHALKREYEGYRSIDINSDYRVLYQVKQENDEEIVYYFVLFGTHYELYG